MSFFQEKKLGQVNPDGSATAVTLVATQVNTTKMIKNIFVMNAGAAATFGIYHSISSTASVTASTALYHNYDISASTTMQVKCFIPVESSGSAVAVKASTANITFTAYGAETVENPFNDTA